MRAWLQWRCSYASSSLPAYQSTSVLVYQLSSLHFQSNQDQYQQASTGFHARNPALLLQAWKQNILEYLYQRTKLQVPRFQVPAPGTGPPPTQVRGMVHKSCPASQHSVISPDPQPPKTGLQTRIHKAPQMHFQQTARHCPSTGGGRVWSRQSCPAGGSPRGWRRGQPHVSLARGTWWSGLQRDCQG